MDLNANEMLVIYVPYMYMASIWDLYGFNGQFLQPTYMGLTRDIYWTYEGHISHSHISLISPI